MEPQKTAQRPLPDFKPPAEPLEIPAYLHDTYWWAYEHPKAPGFWDHGFMINFILLGNYNRLVRAVLEEFPDGISGDMLQVSCAYGRLTPSLEEALTEDGHLDVIDILPTQLDTVRRKLKHVDDKVRLIQCDATALNCPDNSYDNVLMFFLPHEVPEQERRMAMSEAIRVAKPGGRIIFVEFTNPGFHPLRLYERLVFLLFEPFAVDMWRHELTYWFPEGHNCITLNHKTYFGHFFQKLVVQKPSDSH